MLKITTNLKRIIKNQKKLSKRGPPYFAYPYGEGTNREQHYLVDHVMITFSLDNEIVTQGYDLS